MIGLRKYVQLPFKTGFSSGLLPCLLASVVLLQACEAPSGPGGLPGKSSGRPGVSKAIPGKTGKVRAGAGSIVRKEPDREQVAAQASDFLDAIQLSGNTIELATAIIAANTNPFLSRLPKTLVAPVAEEMPVAIESPVLNPLDSLILRGIIYNAKAPMALISEKEDGPSAIHRKGSLLGNGTIKVLDIKQDKVILQGPGKTKKELRLPEIVGYASSKDLNGKVEATMEALPSPEETPTTGRTPSSLGRLRRLSEQNPSASNPDITLQEP